MKGFSAAWIFGLAFSVAGAYAYTLRGTVVDEEGEPVLGANVLLVSENKSTTTDGDGKFLFGEAESAIRAQYGSNGSWSLQNGTLSVFANVPMPLQVKVFDLMGNKIFSDARRVSGRHFVNLQKIPSSGRYAVNIRLGNYREVFTVSAAESAFGKFSKEKSFAAGNRALKREVAFSDSLRISAESYETLTVAVPNPDTSLTVTLKKSEVRYAFGWAKGNSPVPTRGCGKNWNRVKSGSYDFAWSKGTRTIRIDIPDNYDNNKPYRLVFGMHCMGGWAGGVREEGYYGLKPLDTENTTIFVAPEGNGNLAPWAQDDYTLFDELLSDLEENLCIDSSRVFSTGFSYGSMFTNGLSRNHQDVLRGVAVYETADVNIWLPEHSGKPIAWMGVLGLQDDLCTPAMGRSARDTALKYASAEGKDATAEQAEEYPGYGGHVCYNYTSVDPRFPVRWCTQNGGHIWNHKDSGAGESWVPQATWDFITQF